MSYTSSIFAPLRKELTAYLTSDQIDTIYDTYLYATEAHGEQCRASEEPYIIHPVAVATKLAKMHMDPASIMAAILHDVIEDTNISKEDLEERFGSEVVKLVDGVTKLDNIQFESREEAQAENFRKMVMAMADDIRVILIRLADRLHNVSTLEHLENVERRRRIARETLEIYAPVANRLGMNSVRLKLEEKGFAALYPSRHRVLQEAIKKARGNRKEVINLIEISLKESLQNAKIPDFKLKGREKHLYGIYSKMKSKKLRFSEIMDVYGVRIVVNTVPDCYRTLGVVHNLYKPVPFKFKDYIAIPKVNGYQSLHTVLFGPYRLPVEIQIRTDEMEKMAENGIAAHWLYKSNVNIANKSQLRAREWIKGLLEIQKTAGDSLRFIEHVRTDLFPDEVYVFTPDGDIMELPNGATAIDFAYNIHSDIGNNCVAVKIDRRLAPLSSRLESGQTVEIITAAGNQPNPDWLNFVVTGKARSKIYHFLKHQKRSESIELGKRLLDRALAMQHKRLEDIPKINIRKVLKRIDLETLDDLFEEIGLGNQMAQIIANRLTHVGMPQVIESEGEEEPLHIRGTEGVVINFANCCKPIPGDPIEGILTAEHGIVIHCADCVNLVESRRQPEKCVFVRWAEQVVGDFEVKLQVEVVNQRGILANIALAVGNVDANVNSVNVVEHTGHCNLLNLIITVKDKLHLEKVIKNIQHVKDVIKVTRQYDT